MLGDLCACNFWCLSSFSFFVLSTSSKCCLSWQFLSKVYIKHISSKVTSTISRKTSIYANFLRAYYRFEHLTFPFTTFRRPKEASLRASSPNWASEASLARTRERAAKPRGAGGSGDAHFACSNRRACSQAIKRHLHVPKRPEPGCIKPS